MSRPKVVVIPIRFVSRLDQCCAEFAARWSAEFLGYVLASCGEIFEREAESQLPGSRLRCFIFFSPFIFRVDCFMWLWMCSSISFFCLCEAHGDRHKLSTGFAVLVRCQIWQFRCSSPSRLICPVLLWWTQLGSLWGYLILGRVLRIVLRDSF